jgi:cell division protein FtsB
MSFKEYVPAVLLIVVGCVALYFILPAYTNYRQTRITVRELTETVAQQEFEIQKLRKDLTALRTDYRAIERVAREKFGLCRDGERIYHFDGTPTPAAIESPAARDRTAPAAP